jgi:hypothetical protein
LKGITIGLGRITDCTVTPLFLAPNLNLVADASRLVSIPVVGGLHHRYIRVAA